MVSDDVGTHNLSARIRKTIQSIKEIVGNHSEADIYVILKESNMDPNETTQKLLYQDPYHEVKRKKGKKKENTAYKGLAEPRKLAEHTQGFKSHAFSDRNTRRAGFIRNSLPGISRQFRVVRDNRVNQNTNWERRPASVQSSTSASGQAIQSVSGTSLTRILNDQKHIGARNSEGQKSSQVGNGASDSIHGHIQDANTNSTNRKEMLEATQAKVPSSVSQLQGPRPYSATSASNNSVVGLYSSSSDPVHVPSNSRSSGTVGAIRREVGVVGIRRQSSENSAKHSSVPNSSFSTSLSGKDISSISESFYPSTVVIKSDQLIQTSVSESVVSSNSVSKTFLTNQHGGKPHQQLLGHQKAPQPNMEWKPKSSQKSSFTSPGVIGTTAIPVSSPKDNSTDLKIKKDHLPEKLPRVSVSENEHVIIPQHLRVPEADRRRLTFGSFGLELNSTEIFSSRFEGLEISGQLNDEPSASVSDASASLEDVNQVDLLDGQLRISGSASPASTAVSEHLSTDNKEASSPGNLESYADIGMVQNSSASYTAAEPQQKQESPRLPSFPAYDPQTGYDMPFFRPSMDESVRGQAVPSPGEALSSHVANSMATSTVAMVQQQSVPQMYPQVHVSHFMPYRQYLSPVYVPPMAVPGYSSNPAYPHPSNGNSYLLLPGGSSHLAASGLKYGASQYKPIPAGTPTGFGNYTNSAGYAINAQGTVGGATGLDDSTRMKYKDGNLYVPNPQADTSEMWIQAPRELPGLQSAPYYNIPGQAPHTAFLPSHTGHGSFNAGATAQPTHMQFTGLYHPSPQQASIPNPHHMVPGMGSNVGVGVAAAAPGAQVGAYQQPQLGHLNWNTSF